MTCAFGQSKPEAKEVGILLTSIDSGADIVSAEYLMYGQIKADGIKFVENPFGKPLAPTVLTKMLAGEKEVTREVFAKSKLTLAVLGRMTYKFRPSSIDKDLFVCDLVLLYRIVNRAGDIVHSDQLSAPGTGYSEATSLDMAVGRLITKLYPALVVLAK